MNKWWILAMILLLTAFLACGTVHTQAHTSPHDYIVVPASEELLDDPNIDRSGADFTLTFWELPLRLKMIHIFSLFLTAIGLAKFSPVILAKSSLIFTNKNRHDIFDYIGSNPGCSVAEISSDLDMNRGTVKYHLRKLHNEHKITVSNRGKHPIFFQNNSVYSKRNQELAPFLREKHHQRILLTVMDNPGITNDEISRTLDLSKSTVSCHVSKLVSSEILQVEKDGRYRRYSVNPELEPELVRFIPSVPSNR